MTREKLFADLSQIISEELSCSISDIKMETCADDIDGWDSLAHARLILRIEDSFNLRLPGDRLFELDNVGELANLISDARG